MFGFLAGAFVAGAVVTALIYHFYHINVINDLKAALLRIEQKLKI